MSLEMPRSRFTVPCIRLYCDAQRCFHFSHSFALPRRGRSPLYTGGTYFGTDSLTYVYVSIRQQLLCLALDPLTNRIALRALR
ncbi:hypothetical protein M404DRAFT_1006100 [Pisolithus tinctorius Marx 270]|uniref:Uncharacterized protein n=1 Tax=Pisolithus tinctorius Marx 270 TaxID=870435 RepID=A0A0C3IKG9_PISTI|nr:hypothetical protein M404DRAFT_1006100 [Pisolithus tinctorius Marx 270]